MYLIIDSTNQESFQLPLQELLTRCYGSGQNSTQLGAKGVVTATNTVPLDMKLLDSLTVHAKMRYGYFATEVFYCYYSGNLEFCNLLYLY